MSDLRSGVMRGLLGPEDRIKQEFQARELDWLSAVERLQNLGYAPEDAEDMVIEWNDENLRQRR